MLKVLLEGNGTATVRDIANAFLAHDESQIEYYEHITKVWPWKTLSGHGLVRRDGDTYQLAVNSSELSASQRAELIRICDEKIAVYEQKRGREIWEHRVACIGEISGSVRYEVLKRAGFHCELCGISADERALDVDHILLRKHGGTDDLENLQALCWKCNENKGDRDDTDFRILREQYATRDSECPFCAIPKERVIAENSLAYGVRDKFPVTPMHSLVIPKRHVTDYFDLMGAENNAVTALLRQMKLEIQAKDESVSAFNVGVNNGEDAGQTVSHVHIHLIPRRRGDVEKPRGGVRGVIVGKAAY